MINKLKNSLLPIFFSMILLIGCAESPELEVEREAALMDAAMSSPRLVRNEREDGQETGAVFGRTDAQQDGEEQQAINLVAAVSEVALHLGNYPDWAGEAWQNDEVNNIWDVNFYSEAEDEWLGNGTVNLNTQEVLDYFVPRELTPEEFQEQLAIVEDFVLNDPEVLAILGDVSLWDHESYYNRWDANWDTYFWHGIDAWTVITVFYNDEIQLDSIIDQNAFDEAEQDELNRNDAIQLAYASDGIWEVLGNVDDWHAYVEAQSGSVWTVEFVGDGQEYFYAVVDIDSQQILESGPGGNG